MKRPLAGRVSDGRLSAAWAQAVAWVLLAAVNTIVISMTVPWPDRGGGIRLLHHVYDIGHLVSLGWLSAAFVTAWNRWAPSRRGLGYAGTYVAAVVVAWFVLDEDLAGAARTLGGDAWFYVLLLVASAAIPGAAFAGRLFARPLWRALPLIAALAVAMVNHRIYPNAYQGLHLWLAWIAAAAAGGALVGAVGPLWRPPPPIRLEGVVGVVAALSAATLLVWPRNAVVIELYRTPGTVLAPYLARIHFESADARPVIGSSAAWFTDRSTADPVPPSGSPLVENPIVILISIDAVRADVFDKPEFYRDIPTLHALRSDSVAFSLARSTGTQTVYTLTTLFAGTHYSQQYWSRKNKKKRTGQLWPYEDKTVRFPELLQEADIPTVTYASAWWLVSSMGVVRGFTEELKIKSKEKTDYNFALAKDVMAPALARLEAHGAGPMFLFMHFMEPHAPYTRGRKKGNRWQNYVREIGMVDKQISAMLDVLERTGLWDRTILIITSDHGEAFGEHRTKKHATTLYEELLRVPLFIRVPGVAPREVDEPVSTVDLGPTILDLYGLPTPPHFIGQSLAPFLRGKDVRLTRPILAEGRLKQALITRDGIKAIRDLRRGTLEAYDLNSDPLELRNIVDSETGEEAMDRLRLFFQVHTYRKDGYQVPLRK